MATTHTIVDSPIGPLTLRARDGVLSGLHMQVAGHPPRGELGTRRDSDFVAASRQLAECFAGERTDFDVPLHLDGTDFQRRVWHELTRIPHGETRSYLDIARRVGGADRVRAVGLANGRNPVAIIVPCHRVIGADGSLVGYGGGLDRKRFLLDLEAGATTLFPR